ncbi:MAG: U32 family peptidase [Desulfobacterales bacterium]|nr:MAG: U32 family peptidase [Desulfobacterales bacterium]
MGEPSPTNRKPDILAPAGNKASFLAALAAGAEAVYCGLKLFSARMEAKNFTPEELIPLVELAHDRGTEVHVAINVLLKPDELNPAGEILEYLNREVKPDAVIVQDLALLQLVRQTGFAGEIHLSTLANVSFAAALQLVKQELGVHRVVLPRELNVDEIKTLAQACPPALDLEVFIHGALCYGVSGRCYWSTYLGGKSGLRGRCVQPCRRRYTQNRQTRRFFSCQDLSLDVLVKVLATIPQVRSWKIEGRKKGPHYVYYTVQGYRLLRDQGGDADMRRDALGMLSRALGRVGTHYHFLPQRPQNPVSPDDQTGSGLLLGRIKGSGSRSYLAPREELLPGDVLRLGFEDAPGHRIERIKRSVPRGGRFYIKPAAERPAPKGTPVYLIDRREMALTEMVAGLEAKLRPRVRLKAAGMDFKARLPSQLKKKAKTVELYVYRRSGRARPGSHTGIWLSVESLRAASGRRSAGIWWWLPTVIWPADESQIQSLVRSARQQGGRNFVLNAPWQIALFPASANLNLWAGPFCNLSNPLALHTAQTLGFAGAIVSPELGREDYLRLPRHSPIALGVVSSGHWPLCVSRTIGSELETAQPFDSPKGEQAWAAKYGSEWWVYPNWQLDLSSQKQALARAGYRLFVHLMEPVPAHVKLQKRPGEWNWHVGLR